MDERGGPWYGAWWVWPWLVLVGLLLLFMAWSVASFGHLANGLAAAVAGVGMICLARRGVVASRERVEAQTRRPS